jgi:hypothetical protein
MLTEKDYCDYETRNELIKLGYPAHLYDNTEVDKILGAILLYEAQKWLREEKEMVLFPSYLGGANAWICEICYKRERLGFGGYNQSYEEALSEGVRASIKILQDEQKENN